MVHIIRPVWEKAAAVNQLGRAPLGYTPDDADCLFAPEPAARTVRGARDLISVALQYGNAFGQGMQAAALKPADSFGNDDVLGRREWQKARATIGRPASRMPSSATNPSLAMAFGLVVVAAGTLRRALRATF